MSMTKEKEEVIKRLEKLVELRKNKAEQIKYDNCICATEDLETVLNMLKEKDKELEKKDKQIDLMAEKIFDEGIVWKDKEEVKQYFKSKAEKE